MGASVGAWLVAVNSCDDGMLTCMLTASVECNVAQESWSVCKVGLIANLSLVYGQ